MSLWLLVHEYVGNNVYGPLYIYIYACVQCKNTESTAMQKPLLQPNNSCNAAAITWYSACNKTDTRPLSLSVKQQQQKKYVLKNNHHAMHLYSLLMHTFVPCDLVPSTLERVPLATNSTVLATVTRKTNTVVVVVAKFPTIFVSLWSTQPHITFCEPRQLTLSYKLHVASCMIPAHRRYYRTAQSRHSTNWIRPWASNTTATIQHP